MADTIIKQRLIGQGAAGKVYMAVPRSGGGLLMAVKSSASPSLRREEEILRSLEGCPDVVECFGGFTSVEVDGSTVYNLILEYAPGGNLWELMQRRGGKLMESEVRVYARMIVRGLIEIHQMGFAHCDLKPRNILVFPGADGGNVVKMADFGIAEVIGKVEGGGGRLRGTPAYLSPETLALRQYGAASDIWSLACSIIEMVTGQRVWSGLKGVDEIFEQVVMKKLVPRLPECLSECGKDFLAKCFIRNPRQRWTAEMLFNHPFVLNHSWRPKACSLSEIWLPHVFFSRPWIPSLPSTVSLPLTFSTCSSFSSGEASVLSNLSLPPGWFTAEEGTPDEPRSPWTTGGGLNIWEC